jgi:hypothetical protein
MKVNDNITNSELDKTDGSPALYHIPKFQIIFSLFLVILIGVSQFSRPVNAYIANRSVSTSSSLPSQIVSHDFQFDLLGSPLLGSIKLEYCSSSPLLEVVCVPPVGFNSANTNLLFQGGDTSFSVHPNTLLSPNVVILTRPPTLSISGTKNYKLGNITNTSQAGSTTYVRIRTYATTNATGSYLDFGSVAYSTQNSIAVAVYVPPYLALCSGVTVAIDCTSTNGSLVNMGDLSKSAANTAETQFSVATNSFTGYNAVLVGSTMVAGNKVIPALTFPGLSQPGVSQFGVNLRKNTAPNVGKDTVGIGTGTPTVGYDQPNSFQFQSGDTVASSPISTEWNRYTLSYLVNVAPTLPAGVYASTLTVIATTTF